MKTSSKLSVVHSISNFTFRGVSWRRLMLIALCLALFKTPITGGAQFNSGANGYVKCLALQPDGKIFVAGQFTTLSGQPCTNLGRLNADGALDLSFRPVAPAGIESLHVQPDGKLLAAGIFTSLGGQACTNLGRLNSDGTLDTTFSAPMDGLIDCVALQPDGKVLVGGELIGIRGQAHTNLVRLNSNGTLDSTFTAKLFGDIYALALQADGQVLVGGYFTNVDDQPFTNLCRLNDTGRLDASFNPTPDAPVRFLAVQANGNILVGGWFLQLGGQACRHFGRIDSKGSLDAGYSPNLLFFPFSFDVLGFQTDGKMLAWSSSPGLVRVNADGTKDTNFAVRANGRIESAAIQAGGDVVVGGSFGLLQNQASQCLGRFANTGLAEQSLSFEGATVTWLRSGTGPDFWGVSFEGSTNGVDWVSLGPGTAVPGGWQVTGVNLPANARIRARGFVAGTAYIASRSEWVVENDLGAPVLLSQQPARLVYYPGSVGSLSAAVAGTGPLGYQWFFEGTALPDKTNAILTLTDIQSINAGRYSVVATNGYGRVSNMVATLTVVPAPGLPPIVMQGPETTNGLVKFSWNTVFGLSYVIEYSSNPDQSGWIALNGPLTGPATLFPHYCFSWDGNIDTKLIVTSLDSTLGYAEPIQPTRRFFRVRYAQ